MELRILKFTVAFSVLYVPFIILLIFTLLEAFAILNSAESFDEVQFSFPLLVIVMLYSPAAKSFILNSDSV